MIEDSKPILFLFLSGTLDVVLTIVTVLSGWAVEINPLVSWISPKWMMCIVEMVGFSLLCLILIPIYKKYNGRYPVKTMAYSWGSVHLAGAFSGAVILVGMLAS
jgi:hypothetical protein